MKIRYVGDPHPHLVVDQLVDEACYRDITFPDDLTQPGASWGLTSTDAEFDLVLRDPGMRMLVDEVRSEPFVMHVLDAFADDMRAAGCLVSPESARLIDRRETREEKERAHLEVVGDPNDVFTRFDLQSKAEGGYREFVHLDWARRIVGGIFFFSDADEEGLEGGELAMYRDRQFANDRWCHDPELVATFAARHNSGVIFLNSNGSFHGPRAIRRLEGRRRWVYYTISSTVDVWPHRPREATRA